MSPFTSFKSVTGGTSAPMSLYVNPTGNDANDGSVSAPLLTIQSALDRLANLQIRDFVTIAVAAGNYAGFVVPAFNIVPRNDGSVAGVRLAGTSVTSTLAQGTATGTLTAVAAGSTATATFTIWTDSLQNWVVDALKGKFIEILTGTGVGLYVIESNTATTVTVLATAVTSAVASTYAIRDAATVVITPVTTANAIPAVGASAGATGAVGILVNGPLNANPNTATVRLEMFRVALTSQTSITGGVAVQNPNGGVTLSRMQLDSSTAGNPLSVRGNGSCTVSSSIITTNTTNAILMAATASLRLGLSSTLIRGLGSGCTGINGGTNPGSVVSLGTGTRIEASFGVAYLAPGWIEISGATKIMNAAAGSASAGIRCRFNGANAGGGLAVYLFAGIGLIVDGRTTTAAVAAEGPVYYRFDGNLIITNAATGISLTEGARVRFSAGSSMTTVTNEIVLDGAVALTVAAMRLLTPKLFTNTYGTIIYE